MIIHQPYPGDVGDAEWEFVAPYLCLLPEDSSQRVYNLRDVFDGLRWIVRTDSTWRYRPKDFPSLKAVHQQSRRWMTAGCFEAVVHDLRAILRFAAVRDPEPIAAIFVGRTLQSTTGSGGRAGDKWHRGSKVHMAVDTLGNLLALHVTPADEQERDQVDVLAEQVQAETGESVETAFIDQGCTGDDADADAASPGIHLVVVSLPKAKKGFVLLPRRRVVERSFVWMAWSHRSDRDYEWLGETLEGLHYVAFSILMLHKDAPFLSAVHITL